MSTIKDIAKLAGVSQGTVSNVLNKKGNVSSKKIILVQNAAKELNYSMHLGAQILRAGKNQSIALVVPNIEDKKYLDFFLSCKSYVVSKMYTLDLFITNDIPEEEKKIIDNIQSLMYSGIITFSSLYDDAPKYYLSKKYSEKDVLFVERNKVNTNNFLGFDYFNFLSTALEEYCNQKFTIYFIVDENSVFQEPEIKMLLKNKFKKLEITIITISYLFRNIQLLRVFDNNLPQIIFSENENIDFACRKLVEDEYIDFNCNFYCFTSLTTFYKGMTNSFEMNYHMLGKTSAKMLISTSLNNKTVKKTLIPIKVNNKTVLNNTPKAKVELNVLLLDSPPAYVLSHFFKTYTKETGVKINTSIVSYSDIYSIYDNLDETSNYDLLRIGADVFSWYAPKILQPLNLIDKNIELSFNNIIPGLIDNFSNINSVAYAIPISPSIQFLYYRKDLFEDSICQRLFKEHYKEDLTVPKTFDHYLKIARFFTQSINPSSPTKYGTTLTLGHSHNVVAGSEFMTRYFSYEDSLFNKNNLNMGEKGTRKSLENILKLKQCIDEPKGWWTESAKDISNGKIAMTILYSNFASDFYSRNSNIVNKLGYGIIPGGKALLGGGSLGVSKYSKNPVETLNLMKWLISDSVASALAYYCGTPITKNALENYEIIDSYPWLSLFQRQLDNLSFKKLSNFDYFNENEFVNLLGQGVVKYFNNEKNDKEVINFISKEFISRQNNLF